MAAFPAEDLGFRWQSQRNICSPQRELWVADPEKSKLANASGTLRFIDDPVTDKRDHHHRASI